MIYKFLFHDIFVFKIQWSLFWFLAKVTDIKFSSYWGIWQTGLYNNHLQAEIFPIEDDRVMFMFRDGSAAWDAKDFLIEQDSANSLYKNFYKYNFPQSRSVRRSANRLVGWPVCHNNFIIGSTCFSQFLSPSLFLYFLIYLSIYLSISISPSIYISFSLDLFFLS